MEQLSFIGRPFQLIAAAEVSIFVDKVFRYRV